MFLTQRLRQKHRNVRQNTKIGLKKGTCVSMRKRAWWELNPVRVRHRLAWHHSAIRACMFYSNIDHHYMEPCQQNMPSLETHNITWVKRLLNSTETWQDCVHNTINSSSAFSTSDKWRICYDLGAAYNKTYQYNDKVSPKSSICTKSRPSGTSCLFWINASTLQCLWCPNLDTTKTDTYNSCQMNECPKWM